jgi:hypothetical protein
VLVLVAWFVSEIRCAQSSYACSFLFLPSAFIWLNYVSSQLLDGKRATSFPLPVSPRVVLRPYQQEGVNWLAFLRRFGLHGVLADDMVISPGRVVGELWELCTL